MTKNCRNNKYRFSAIAGSIRMGPGAKTTLVLGVIIILAAVYWSVTSFNTLQKPLLEMEDGDKKYKGLIATVGYKDFFRKDTLVFDLKKVPLDLEATAPFEYLLQYLIALENKGVVFSSIEIKYKGKTKFMLDGDAVHNLAALSMTLKPLEIAVDFPPMLKKPDGKQAYTIPYGDEQWVEQKKLHNFESFLTDWYLKDLGMEVSKSGKSKETKTPEKSKESASPQASPNIEEIPEIPDETPINHPGAKDPAINASPSSTEVPAIEPDEI